MTSRGSIIAVAAGTAARGATWRAELTDTVKLAVPMALTQLGQIAMMTSDLALLGRLGGEVVAAVALANTVLFSAFVIGMGLSSAVAPLAAQAFGARRPRTVRRALRVGLWAVSIVGAPLTVALLWGGDILVVLGQAQRPAELAGRYLTGLAWCLIPAWAFIAVRGFMSAVNRPEPALWITLAAIPVNFVVAYALIYGAIGLPRLGLLGAGLATTAVNVGMCLVAIWIACACRPFRKYRVLGRFWRLDRPLFRELLVIGTPISGMLLLEFGLFAAAALIMGRIGTTALAAHQIALQVAAIVFMVPLGISLAATVRVGHAAGRRDAAGARRAGFVALGLGAGFMVGMAALVTMTRDLIPLAFLGAQASDAEATVALAATLLTVATSFFVADGLQVTAVGALRGLNDTRVPLLFAAVSLWCVGFAGSCALAFPAGQGAVGVWIGLSLGLAVYAILLVWRFHALTGREQLPAMTTDAR